MQQKSHDCTAHKQCEMASFLVSDAELGSDRFVGAQLWRIRWEGISLCVWFHGPISCHNSKSLQLMNTDRSAISSVEFVLRKEYPSCRSMLSTSKDFNLHFSLRLASCSLDIMFVPLIWWHDWSIDNNLLIENVAQSLWMNIEPCIRSLGISQWVSDLRPHSRHACLVGRM